MKKELTNQFLERKDRLIHEHVHDPYRTKPKIPAVCPICFAVFRGGRWQWAAWWSINAHHQICPACHRTRDNYPAGTVTIRGEFAARHRSVLTKNRKACKDEQQTEYLYEGDDYDDPHFVHPL
jgi:hypothetical protein